MARHFEITVQKNDKELVTSLSWSLQEDLEKTDGVYCLRTNRQGVNEQGLWDNYNTIRDVEDAFRCMKSDLGFRPIAIILSDALMATCSLRSLPTISSMRFVSN